MTLDLKNRRRLAFLPALVAMLALALPGLAAAADVEIEVVTIKATGKPTGADPVIDEAIQDLPAVQGLCRMYARCAHDGTTKKQVAWSEAVKVGGGKSGLHVSARADGDRIALDVRIGEKDSPCLENSSSVAAGKPMVRFCERSLPDGTYIYLITARRLDG